MPNNPLSWKEFFQWIDELKVYAKEHNTTFITQSHIGKGHYEKRTATDYKFNCGLKKINQFYLITIETEDSKVTSNVHDDNEDIVTYMTPYTNRVKLFFKKKDGDICIEKDDISYPIHFQMQKEGVPPISDGTP
jgi:hypothetical protein